ncbi:MAG TPA: dihydrofolate reductase family protein [Thermodesulfobacteriota bacterium]|nr:dihydrofolate reductase family protein [Thermodesulfobacteriota bacterium]
MPEPAAACRPFVTTNFAMSVDGKVTLARPGPFNLSSAEDKRRMARLRAEADAVLWGAGSVLVDEPQARVPPEQAAARAARGQPPQPLHVLVTARGRVPLVNRFFRDPDLPRLVAVSDAADPATVAAYRSRAEVLVQPGGIDLAALLAHLHDARGVRRLLCEGGPSLLWSLLAADLVDELHVTLVPVLVGGREALTMVEGAGFGRETVRRLDLVACEAVAGELFLTYRVRR